MDAWQTATEAIADNSGVITLATLQFVNLMLAEDAGGKRLNAVRDLAADSVDAETVVLAEAEAESLAEVHAVVLADTAAKIRTAEDWHPATIAAYRAAASAWRGLLESGAEQ